MERKRTLHSIGDGGIEDHRAAPNKKKKTTNNSDESSSFLQPGITTMRLPAALEEALQLYTDTDTDRGQHAARNLHKKRELSSFPWQNWGELQKSTYYDSVVVANYKNSRDVTRDGVPFRIACGNGAMCLFDAVYNTGVKEFAIPDMREIATLAKKLDGERSREEDGGPKMPLVQANGNVHISIAVKQARAQQFSLRKLGGKKVGGEQRVEYADTIIRRVEKAHTDSGALHFMLWYCKATPVSHLTQTVPAETNLHILTSST